MILVPVVAGTVLSVLLLLTLVDVENARDRIELIKTGLAVGAGTGGVAALVLAGRRQWSTERSIADVSHDAGERRITDLYSKAADQLGSDKAAVRLAGLYSLQRLAQDTPPLRQTIVNVLCAYLRMPTEAGDQEPEVRRTAQHILRWQLRPHHPDDFWADIDIDLGGAVLDRFNFGNVQVRRAIFAGTTFAGWTTFKATRFDRFANFGGATFGESVDFEDVRFANTARFSGAKFNGVVAFDNATFLGPARFGGVRANGLEEVPDGAVFAEHASFTGATFSQPPVFDHVQANFPLPG